MTVDPTDNLIVQRGSTLGKIEVQNMATIQNNDLLIVGRGSDSFKITGQDFKNSLAGGVDLQGSAVVAPTVADIGDTLTCTASAAGGTTPYTFDYQWFCQLDGTVDWVEHPGSNTDTVVLDAGDVDYRFRCHVTVTGANGGTLNLISNETGVIGDPALAPEIGSVSLVEQNPDADPRFTDQEFVASVSMNEDGVPVSTKTIDAYVEGAITTQVQFDEPLESQEAASFNYTWDKITSGGAMSISSDKRTLSKSASNSNGSASGFEVTTADPKYYVEIRVKRPGGGQNGDTIDVGFNYETSTNAYGLADYRRFWAWDGSKYNKVFFADATADAEDYIIMIAIDLAEQKMWFGLNGDWHNGETPESGINTYYNSFQNGTDPIKLRATQSMGTLAATAELIQSRFDPPGFKTNESQKLIFANGTDMSLLAADDQVTQGATTGVVSTIKGTKVALSSSSGDWTDGVNVTGTPKTITSDNVKKYLKFDSSGNVTDLLSAPQDPAYETTDANPQLTLKFPSTFPSGNAPDDELSEGTKLTVEVTATNTAGTDGPVTAEVQPEGASGPDVTLNGMTTLWSGNGANNRNIVNGIDLANHDGLVWIKDRTYDGWHQLFDTVRGVQRPLATNNNDPESPPAANKLDGFNVDGFELGSHVYVNANGYDYVSWTFQKAAGYFDVIKTTKTNGTDTVQHNLGQKPGFIIVKSINTNHGWLTYHSAVGHTKYGVLSDTRAFSNDSGNTAFVGEPTDTVFTIGSSMGPAGEYICYLFAEDTPGAIKCGSYTGTGASQTIDVGFEPQWVLIKGIGPGRGWFMFDNKRGDGAYLQAASNTNEGGSPTSGLCNFTANGFETTTTNGSVNGSGEQYIYVAIAAPTTRSLTQEEFNEQAIKFGTYEHRKHVNCARMSEENRDALIQYFAEQGYSLQDILTYL